MSQRLFHQLEPYTAPEWAQGLQQSKLVHTFSIAGIISGHAFSTGILSEAGLGGVHVRVSFTTSNITGRSSFSEMAAYLKVPKERFTLAVLPTPIHRWNVFGVPKETELWIKRDDLTGAQLSGNKVRKLEFLVADALSSKHDSVVTIGGIQSNHCRATAVAAKYAGLETHLVLRNSRTLADKDPGLVGNLLVERLVGAHIHQVTKEEYVKHGSVHLGNLVVEQLKKEGKNPALIPVGGSNAIGTFGYLEFMRELHDQTADAPFTDIVMACGSGGTSAGIALGNHLSGYGARIWAYGVCDDPTYFYDYIDSLFKDLGADPGLKAKDLLTAVQAKGAGYAISQSDELTTLQEIASSTGVILDPTYGGKAMIGFLTDLNTKAEDWKNRRVLFLHTGGLLSMYEKADQLQPLVASQNTVQRLQV